MSASHQNSVADGYNTYSEGEVNASPILSFCVDTTSAFPFTVNTGVRSCGCLQDLFMRQLEHLHHLWLATVRQQQMGQRLAHDAFKAACSSHNLFLEILNGFQTQQEASFHMYNQTFERQLNELRNFLDRNATCTSTQAHDEQGSQQDAPEPAVVLTSVVVQTTLNQWDGVHFLNTSQQQSVGSDHERFDEGSGDDVSTLSEQAGADSHVPTDGPVIE
ncbi:hypothetical protein R1sor_015216 [Riccia sorocarpa]|uniref:Uncharacterized protein n=1 Tax=Riccia sorocarpa TaxID=122646 RepID=A0ABD3HBN3_9MARC